MQTYSLKPRDVPVLGEYDIVVCGGGPSGIPAALAAQRQGCRVLLVEQTGQLGGAGTSAGVSHWLGGRTSDNRQQCVAGIFAEITERMIARGDAIDPLTIPATIHQPHGWSVGLAAGVPFDPIAAGALLDEMMLEAGVDVLYFTSFVDAVVEEGFVSGLVLFNKSGLQLVKCAAVVDATGDADVAARAGCNFVKGRMEDGLMTPASLMFHVDRVDQDALAGEIYRTGSRRFKELIQNLREAGEWNFPYDIFISVQLHEKGTMMINTTRICDVDGTNGLSISRGMMQGRKEVMELFSLMKKHFPGFSSARIKSIAPVLGIRETRRIVGEYIYTLQDVLEERNFEDTIGFSGYGFDLPDPKRPSYQPLHATPVHRKRLFTPIPYRVMVPRPIQNIICPGRAISVERDVLGPLREQAPCMAMGHAAGLAAVQAVKKQMPFCSVDINKLRSDLLATGAIINLEPLASDEGLF